MPIYICEELGVREHRRVEEPYIYMKLLPIDFGRSTCSKGKAHTELEVGCLLRNLGKKLHVKGEGTDKPAPDFNLLFLRPWTIQNTQVMFMVQLCFILILYHEYAWWI